MTEARRAWLILGESPGVGSPGCGSGGVPLGGHGTLSSATAGSRDGGRRVKEEEQGFKAADSISIKAAWALLMGRMLSDAWRKMFPVLRGEGPEPRSVEFCSRLSPSRWQLLSSHLRVHYFFSPFLPLILTVHHCV